MILTLASTMTSQDEDEAEIRAIFNTPLSQLPTTVPLSRSILLVNHQLHTEGSPLLLLNTGTAKIVAHPLRPGSRADTGQVDLTILDARKPLTLDFDDSHLYQNKRGEHGHERRHVKGALQCHDFNL
jgi:hypothetical protein